MTETEGQRDLSVPCLGSVTSPFMGGRSQADSPHPNDITQVESCLCRYAQMVSGQGPGLQVHGKERFLHTSLCMGKWILLGKMTPTLVKLVQPPHKLQQVELYTTQQVFTELPL